MNTADVSKQLQVIARVIDESLQQRFGERVGFTLQVFPFKANPTQVQYCSNAKREDAQPMLEALLERWKRGDPDVPFHEMN